jgi:hypothetical protein
MWGAFVTPYLTSTKTVVVVTYSTMVIVASVVRYVVVLNARTVIVAVVIPSVIVERDV